MSGRIPQSTISDLLAKIDILDIIHPRLSLVKTGKNYRALCPFHEEKTPSFTVNPEKQFYYCFSCHAHGNAIQFLMNHDHMEFRDALSDLASQAGVELHTENHAHGSTSRTKLSPLYATLQQISEQYQENLRQSATAIHYLKNRHLSGQTAKTYAIGYATPGWNNLSRDFTPALLLKTGMMVSNPPKRDYDRFRHRIMFPIRNRKGQIIAFGGRSLSDDQAPKYLNSPETDLFQKRNELYGLYEARQANKQLDRLLIVEGYMDVLMLAQHGISYAVSTLGTAVGSQHIQTGLRYTNKLIFCFDGDRAGQQAAWKALLLALPLLKGQIDINFLFLPDGEDPDSLIQKIGVADFTSLIDQADPLSTVFFRQIGKDCPPTSIEAKAQYGHTAMQHLNTLPEGIFYQLMQKKLASILNVTVEELHRYQSATPAAWAAPTLKQALNHRPHNTTPNPAQLASALLLQQPQLAQSLTELSTLEKLDLPDKDLLIYLIQQFQTQPNTTTGQLLADPKLKDQKELIAELAAIQFPFSDAALSAEFEGAISHLNQLYAKQQAALLINKAKFSALSPSEKQSLRDWLSTRTAPLDSE